MALTSRLRKAVSDLTLDKLMTAGDCPGKLLSPARCRACIDAQVTPLGAEQTASGYEIAWKVTGAYFRAIRCGSRTYHADPI